MAISDYLPKAEAPGESFLGGAKTMQQMIDSMIKNRQQQQELQETNRYHKGTLDIQQQEQNRLGRESPLKMELLKQQIQNAKLGGVGGKGGVGIQDQLALMRQVIRDNPGTDMDQANKITSAWLSGQKTLPDGTPVPEPSGNSAFLLDELNKRRTTASLMNSTINAQQSEKELEVLDKYATEGLKGYGDTILNMSPPQIVDTFKSDDASQEKLGKLIGSQALQFEIAQIRNRIAMGQPGITSTEEMMKMSHQLIDSKFPMLSFKARNYASKYLNKAIKEGFEARQKVGVRASAAFNKPEESGNASGGNVKKWKVVDNKLVEA